MVGLSATAQQDVSWTVFAGRLGSATAVYSYLVVRRPLLDVPLRVVPTLAAVGVLGVVANALFTLATTVGYLSTVAVLATLSPVVIAVYARLFAGERLTRAQLVAALVVLAGVVCLTTDLPPDCGACAGTPRGPQLSVRSAAPLKNPSTTGGRAPRRGARTPTRCRRYPA